ncbi:MAG: hypothetical protein WC527_06410 [Candidatus Margulisiibacteriota bacterium]
MKKYQLPLDGSVVILEDKVGEALPLIKLLSKKGIATTYYTGADIELPEKPVQKIRLAFIDIQLFGPSDAHSYAQNILRILDRIIPVNNGPYILIVWSKTDDINAETLEREIMAWTKPPAIVLGLSKSSYFKRFVDLSRRDNLIEKLDNSLKTRFSKEDLDVVKNAINGFYQTDIALAPKKDALKKISNELLSMLQGLDVLQLFAAWESFINKTSGEIVESFSSLHPSDAYWQSNLKSTIYRMAHTQLGKRLGSAADEELIRNALKTLNHIFLGAIENTTYKNNDFFRTITIGKNISSFSRKVNGKKYDIKWSVKSGDYQLYVDGKVLPTGAGPKKKNKIYDLSKRGTNNSEKDTIRQIIDDYLSIEPEINAKLFIDFNISAKECSGAVYKKSVHGFKRKISLLGNYFNVDSKIFRKNGNQAPFKKDELKNFVFIEMNVIPSCDNAQAKWLKSKMRLLPGIMFPKEYFNDLKEGDSFYKTMPLLKIDNQCYQCVFDFRLLKSEDIPRSISKRRKTWFKIRNEVLADILSRLSSHASRVGVALVE